ncbi:hypothetical protein [Streptomyces phaeochromogenes]|uniref:hypothetical protein n=1 Tax=Streptomyces phaeochromogenes TaxID=1923 RepID=UPI0033D0C63B|nr:hypothetical protein OG478_49365 [Streptomyces phaeochromogenes]WSW20647.1 hypothetical protein OG277_51025 [Streptomyces phaeochromogenes]
MTATEDISAPRAYASRRYGVQAEAPLSQASASGTTQSMCRPDTPVTQVAS